MNKSEEELERASRPLGLDPGEYSLALIYKSGDAIILANGRAERKIKENFGCLVTSNSSLKQSIRLDTEQGG